MEQVLPGSPLRSHSEAEIHAAAIVKDTCCDSSWWTTGAWEGPAESQLLSDHNSHSSHPYTMWGWEC